MEKIEIKKATESDLQEILDLQYLAFQYAKELFKAENIPPLTQKLSELEAEYKAGIVLKAVADEKIVGSVRAKIIDGTTYVAKLIVNPENQGCGIGTNLLLEIEKYCVTDRYELFTSTRTAKTVRLYERLGYKKFQEKAFNDELTFVYLEKIKE